MVGRIDFCGENLKLEELIRLIYFDKSSSNFEEKLQPVISFLRKHSNLIRTIGYNDSLTGMHAILRFDPKNFTSDELMMFNIIR